MPVRWLITDWAHDGLGHPPPVQRRHLAQSSLIFEHEPQDMAVRVSAAMSLGELDERLRLTGQFFPLDSDLDLSLREVITHNLYGPLRLGYGGVRELLLGLSVIDGQGRNIRVGGKTVKNVAGYDLSRLLVGSLGELGFIYEVVLRTYVIPENVLAVEMQVMNLPRLDELMTHWLVGDARADQMGLIIRDGKAKLCIGFMGSLYEGTARLKYLEAFVDQAGDGGIKIETVRACSLGLDAAKRAQRRAWRRKARALVKMIVPPASTGKVCKRLLQAVDPILDERVVVEAYPVYGSLYVGGDFRPTRGKTTP